jgi:DNA-binding beta-propeller fold protein YncE
VRKLGPGSNELWTRQFAVGEGTFAEARSVRTDASGNVLVAGNQSSGIFVRKFNPDGSELWTALDDSGYLQGHSLSVDGSGNVLVAGLFVRKYDPDGGVLWSVDATDFGGSPACVDVDGAGNVFVVGSATDGVVLRKYDPDGNVLWTSEVFASTSPHALSVDEAGNALVASNITGALPGQTSLGDGDAFVKRYDPEGNELGARQFGTSAFDRVFSVSRDAKGSVLLAGQTAGTLSGETILGGGDAFVLKLLE